MFVWWKHLKLKRVIGKTQKKFVRKVFNQLEMYQVCTDYCNLNWNQVHISPVFNKKLISLKTNGKWPPHLVFWLFAVTLRTRYTHLLWRVQTNKRGTLSTIYTTNNSTHFPSSHWELLSRMHVVFGWKDEHLSIFNKLWRYATSLKNGYAEKIFLQCLNTA